MDVDMTESGSYSTQDPISTLKSFFQDGMDVEHSQYYFYKSAIRWNSYVTDLVEREASPCDYSLVNPSYVGFMPDIEGSRELSGATVTVCKPYCAWYIKKNIFLGIIPFS